MVESHQRKAGWTLPLPEKRLGLVVLPGSRTVWWTGRVAIGLRYEGRSHGMAPSGQRQLAEPEPR